MKLLKRILIPSAIVAAAAFSAVAGVEDTFVNAPQNIFPLLDRTTRLDMLDYYRSNMSTASANRLDGKSRITAVDKQSIMIESTGSSDIAMVMLPSGADSIIAVITTVKTPAPDSRIDLYSRGWERLPSENYLRRPALADWLTDEGKKNISDVEAFVPFVLISYSYDPVTSRLTMRNNTSEFLSSEINAMVEGFMLPEKVFRWNGKKFQPEK